MREDCHHRIIKNKFDLEIFYPLPPYQINICHYKHANSNLIKKSIDNFDCKNAFEGCDPIKQVYILIETIFTIINNFIPNETTSIDDRVPSWINKKTKGLIHEKNLL